MIRDERVITCDACQKKEIGDQDNGGLPAEWYSLEVEHDFTHTTAHACRPLCIEEAVTNTLSD